MKLAVFAFTRKGCRLALRCRDALMPEKESIRSLAAHRATMCLYLSTRLTEQLQQELLEGGYPGSTPVAVVFKASWPDERIYHCTVETLHKPDTQNEQTRPTRPPPRPPARRPRPPAGPRACPFFPATSAGPTPWRSGWPGRFRRSRWSPQPRMWNGSSP